ncbi:phage tail protein [Paenibacillus sp. LK1]|uniref:phage tail protein n=1 Tax=Paenibacillus sp. LK1 TaxID=2053014 RepID=UPI001C55879E|nr:phage tail protein [Paenibacillus sp. LK1]
MIETMYPAAVNSRQTELATDIDDNQTSFTVLDGSALPPAPNLLTLGTDESAETIKYTGKTGNEITGVTRGFEGVARSWMAGTKLARYFTAYDHNTFRGNIEDINEQLENIPAPQDASLTDKGIVQLSNKTDGDAEDVAATEKAVNDARKAAIRDAGLEVDKTYIRKNRPSNLLPNSSAEMQIQGWTNVSSVPFVSSNDVNDEVSTAFVSNGATTSTSSVLKSDNISIRSGVTYTLSADFINPGGIAGQIIVSLRNASGGSLVESISCDAGTSWHRKAITFALGIGTYYVELSIPLGLSGVNRRVRRIMFSTGTDGDLWNQDSNDRLLFQSVSDGKTAIAAAITGKGVAASGSDTFPQLATKIGQISTGPKYATGTVNSSSTTANWFFTPGNAQFAAAYVQVTGLSFRPDRIILKPTAANNVYMVVTYDNSLGTDPTFRLVTLPTGASGTSAFNAKVTETTTSVPNSAYVGNTSFILPVAFTSTQYTWEAFKF